MLKPANQDYLLQKKLINIYVNTEKENVKVRAPFFYERVKGELMVYKVPLGERESKTMREVRRRFRRTDPYENGAREKFMDYFYRKFLEEIKEERERVFGYKYKPNPYLQRKYRR